MLATVDYERTFAHVAATTADESALRESLEDRIERLTDRLRTIERNPPGHRPDEWIRNCRETIRELAARRHQLDSLLGRAATDPPALDVEAEAREILRRLARTGAKATLSAVGRVKRRLAVARERAESARQTLSSPHMAHQPGEPIERATARLRPHIEAAERYRVEAEELGAIVEGFDRAFPAEVSTAMDGRTAEVGAALAELQAERRDLTTDAARARLVAELQDVETKADLLVGFMPTRGKNATVEPDAPVGRAGELSVRKRQLEAAIRAHDAEATNRLKADGAALATRAESGELSAWSAVVDAAREHPASFRAGLHGRLLDAAGVALAGATHSGRFVAFLEAREES